MLDSKRLASAAIVATVGEAGTSSANTGCADSTTEGVDASDASAAMTDDGRARRATGSEMRGLRTAGGGAITEAACRSRSMPAECDSTDALLGEDDADPLREAACGDCRCELL